MFRVIKLALALSILAAATRASFSKQRHTAVLSRDASMQSTHVELESGVSRMSSIIEDVQSHLRAALVQFESWVTPAKANVLKKASPTKQVAKKAAKMVAVNHTTHGHANHTAHGHAAAEIKAKLQGEQSMLENLFKHLKGNIANFNKEEKKGKEDSEKLIEKLQARVKDEKSRLQKKGLSHFEHELLTNHTKMDEIELKYRLEDRKLGHQMFHTNLKLTHGLMARVKNVLEVYSDAIAKGHVDQELINKVKKEGSAQAFVQIREELQKNTQLYHTQ